MDLSNPTLMMSSLAISTLGLGVFIHGKRMEKLKSLAIGLVMMVFPFFVHSLVWMWIIAGACGAGLVLLRGEG